MCYVNFWGVKNFYVAHLDEDKIQYPLAVTNQQVVYWEDRFLENRLTDKVILEGKSIFLTQDADEFVSQEGLGNSNLPLECLDGSTIDYSGKVNWLFVCVFL